VAATNVEVWQKAVVVSSREIADGIREIVLRQSNPAKAAPGSHLDLMIEISGEATRRSYSIVSQSADLRDLTIAVFKVRNSRGGSIAMHELVVGAQLDITQPIQNFPMRFGAKKYVLLAGGIGVTALLGMANALKMANLDYRVVFAARSRRSMAFGQELKEVHGANFEEHIDDEGTSLNVKKLIESLDAETELYMCGPIRLMDEVRREWSATTFDITNLRFETFGASGWFEPQAFEITFANSSKRVLVGKNESMLEAMENAGLEVMSDCRKGECGLCELKVKKFAGDIDHRDVFLSTEQRLTGDKILCCVSRVADQAGTQAEVEVVLDSAYESEPVR
jgi:vanillate O-demethylase ferredoxin subunit